MAGIVEEEYGNYQIKAGRLSGAFVARAFPKPPVKTQGVIAEATGKSQESAIEALKAMIEERDTQRSADRRQEDRSGIAVPQEDEFLEALRQASLSAAQIAMLRAHSISEEAGMSAEEMTKAAGYKSTDVAEKVFKKAGGLLATYLGVDLSAAPDPSGDGAARIVAFRQEPKNEADPTIWVMHEELRSAVRQVF